MAGHAASQWQIGRNMLGLSIALQALLRAACHKRRVVRSRALRTGWELGHLLASQGASLLLYFSSRKPSSSPWLLCSLASPRRVPSPVEVSVRPKTEEAVKPEVPEGHLGQTQPRLVSKNNRL